MLQCNIPYQGGKMHDLQKRIRIGIRDVYLKAGIAGLVVESKSGQHP